MSEILSQAEIEALLSSLTPPEDSGPEAFGGAGASSIPLSPPGSFGGYTPATKVGSKSAITYEVYDFRRQDKFSKDQLRTLQMIHETFARQAASGLSAFLRSQVNITLISLEQVPYEEYLRSINASVFAITSMPPLSGQAVVELEFGLMFTMLDRLLGGPGRPIGRTMLTDIERPLVKQIIERKFSALKAAWEGVVIVNPGIDALEVSSQFVQIVPPSDIVVTILFEVKIGNTRGAMSLCIPYVVLKPVTVKLSAQKWFQNTSKKVNLATRQTLGAHLRKAEVECSIQLGDTRVTIGEFLALQPGDIIKLDRKTIEDLPLRINGTPKFEVRPELQGQRAVFMVTGALED